jgi:hypothetical protein
MLANVLASILYGKLGIKRSFALLFFMSSLGAVFIINFGESTLMPMFVTVSKFGVTGAFVLVYVCSLDVFPTLFCATALGICNFLARILTILSPEIAEREAPLPMICFAVLSAIGILMI